MSEDPDIIPTPAVVSEVSDRGSRGAAANPSRGAKRGRFQHRGARGFRGNTQRGTGRPNPPPTSLSFGTSDKGKSSTQHLKVPAEPHESLYQHPAWFDVFVSNFGINLVCETFFDDVVGRDQRMSVLISLPQFRYVTCMAFIYRVIRVNLLSSGATMFIPGVSELRQAVSQLELPHPVTKYIEAVGTVQTPTGARIRPHWDNDLYFGPLCLSPVDILEEAGRPIPEGQWHIDWTWISEWNAHTTRMSRQAMGFGIVDNTTAEGRIEMLISYQHRDEAPWGAVIPHAPFSCHIFEAQLGACYMFRDYDDLEQWPGMVDCLRTQFRGSDFMPRTFFGTYATKFITRTPY